MGRLHNLLKYIVAASVALALFCSPMVAQSETLDELFTQLAQDDLDDWQAVEKEIWQEWSKSGSDSMDLLLTRGRAALAQGQTMLAIGHLTALIDHAPEFAEGWNARATAYFHAGLYGPAIADIHVTLSLNPRHFGALSGLGMIMEELDAPDDALFAYRQVLAIHPHRPDVINAVDRLEKLVNGTDI